GRQWTPGLAGAVLARYRAGRAGTCAGLAHRRGDIGADVGGAAAHRGTAARRYIGVVAGAARGGAGAGRDRDQRRRAARAAGASRPFLGSRVMTPPSDDRLAVALH